MGDLVSINIDGRAVQVPAGLNVIEAAKFAGVEIPHFCYHPNLPIAGSCRLCLVSIGTPARDRATGAPILNEDGTQKIAFMPKLAIACGTKVSEGMHVVTNSAQVKDARAAVLEFILLNHPLDCPICDKAGECKLQEYANAYGRGVSRYVEDKNVKPKLTPIGGGKIMLDAERCILCSRCIRFCREIIGRDILSFTKRGSKNEISVYGDDGADSNYLVNIVDGCPVGALTETAFRFKMRTWFLRSVDSISAESSAGINTRVWARGNDIYRITPRPNKYVNDAWMTDSARGEYAMESAPLRLRSPRVDGAPCDVSYALSRAVEIFNLGDGLGIVASARMSFEEQFLLAELAKLSGAKVYAAAHLGEDDGMLLSADRTPNMRGLFVTGLISEYPGKDLKNLASDIRGGAIKNILCFGEDLLSMGLDEKDFKLANVIFCGSVDNPTSHLAKVALAEATNFEKSGLFINRQFRIQKFKKVVEIPDEVVDVIDLLIRMINSYGKTSYNKPTRRDLRELMAKQYGFALVDGDVPSDGILMDSSKFASIKFPEKNALHFTNE